MDSPSREATRALIRFGDSALPNIEAALGSLEARGEESEFAEGFTWILDAYAVIRHRGAFPRLRAMMANPKLVSFRTQMENAIAISLGITSFVGSDGVAGRKFRCRAEEPRDALDELILAWESDNPSWLVEHLGPNASAALDSLLKGRGWSDLRAELWPKAIVDYAAVGYRLDTPGRWSDPNDPIAERPDHMIDSKLRNPAIVTTFTNKLGDDCGTIRIDFIEVPTSPDAGGATYQVYLVNTPGLTRLLKLVSACVANKPAVSAR
jgi:hypothetical protein